MRSGKMMLLASSALLGPMTMVERSKGRYMRAPDGHGDSGSGDAEFDAFSGDSEVVVGDGVPADEPAAQKPAESKPKRKTAAQRAAETEALRVAEGGDKGGAGKGAKEGENDGKPEDKAGAEGGDDADLDDDEDDGEEGDDKPEDKPKPRKKASERIRELTAKNRQYERDQIALTARLDALEKGGLQPQKPGGNQGTEIGDAPNPADAAKYPLGHLDDAYIEDKLEWLAIKKAAERADASLQRQQETEQTQAAETARQDLLGKVDDLATRGTELYDDFQESVVDAGMKGEWRLSQPTFEAAHEAEFGVQILYDLSRDKAEAKRVAELTPFAQLRYVSEKDAEHKAKAKPRTKPSADAPPQTRTSGRNSSTAGNPATDDLDDFERQWQKKS